MNANEFITYIITFLALAHTAWAPAYVASPRHMLDKRLDRVTVCSVEPALQKM